MFSGGAKFILITLFTVLLIALVNLIWWFNYQKTEDMLDAQLGRRLTAVAQSATVALDPATVDSLRYGNVDAYLRTISVLEQVRRSDSLAELFIIDEDYYYLATTLIEPDSVYFLSSINGIYIDSVLFGPGGGSVPTPTYHTGDLYLKSAFAPLIGSDGSVLAVLGVEANVDYFEALDQLKQNLYYASGLSLAGGLLLGLVFLLWQRRIAAAEQRLYMSETHAHLGRMVAVVAHELRNPLMIIRGSAERLAKKTGMPEAGYAIEEVDRLNEIVTGYLDFARSGGSLLSSDLPVRIDLGELIAGVRKRLDQNNGSGSDITIEWQGELPPAGTHIIGYARSLRQVLLNLLINGIESCRDAGKPVKVGVELVLGSETSETVELRVIDSGAGLSKKQQKKIFSPFHTTKKSGSGLGLYLSREIITQMGGRIDLESTPEIGTTIIVRLPVRPKETKEPKESKEAKE
jgi:signal transduction histidine kinase